MRLHGQPMDQASISFAADRMLGRLARMLRLLGYDTDYSPRFTTAALQETAREGVRTILTRGHAENRFRGLTNVFSVQSELAPAQLREVVERFQLDTRSCLWTRCTLCNARIERVEKATVVDQVPPKVAELHEDFFRCSGCGQIYWQGSHVERILKNLAALLNPEQ
ncbi:MAG: Mut7-C RNAse domain-containing protein [Acidobacteriia bacterium]|nr:Mut7-C RNAse domain-containing protein [Terriglobia bacterium]